MPIVAEAAACRANSLNRLGAVIDRALQPAPERRMEMSAQVLEKSRFVEGIGAISPGFCAANRPKMLRFVRKTVKTVAQ